jgi:uncharacterized protein YbjT (DUF2867 family)
MAEQVLLQLILARSKVKALVRDQQTAQAGFGPYVECLGGSTADGALVRKACRGTKSMVLCGEVSPSVLSLAAESGVTHVVLLSAVGAPPSGGVFSLFGAGAEMALLENAKREEMVKRSGMLYTIIRIGKLVDSEGGVSELQLQAGTGPGGVISREDAALVVAQAAEREVKGTCLIVAAAARGQGQPPEDWQRVFKELSAGQPA